MTPTKSKLIILVCLISFFLSYGCATKGVGNERRLGIVLDESEPFCAPMREQVVGHKNCVICYVNEEKVSAGSEYIDCNPERANFTDEQIRGGVQ